MAGGKLLRRSLRALGAGVGALLLAAGPAGVAGAAPTPWTVAEADPSGALADAPRVFFSVSTLGDGTSAVLFGGAEPDADSYADTWIFDGKAWQRVCGDPAIAPADACGPAARIGSGLADTPAGAVLYGGAAGFETMGSGSLADQWSFDATTRKWTAVCGTGALPACAPGARALVGMAGSGGQVVMFGGLGESGLLGDTWVSDDSGSTWTQTCSGAPPTPCGPEARVGAAIAWDGAHFVLFGGEISDMRGTTERMADTWIFDGKVWTPVCGTGALPACGPPGRPSAGFSGVGTPRADQPRALLAGGIDIFAEDATTIFKDAWLWDGQGWTGVTVPWDADPVSFGKDETPPPGPDPLVVMAGGIDCRVVVTGPTVGEGGGEGPLFDGQRTYLFGEDPTGCPTTPAAPATPPVAAPAAAVPNAQLAFTGRTETRETVAGVAAVAIGAALVLASRRRRPVVR